jgi:glycosyltransferase involved in cell wall biosynthesis
MISIIIPALNEAHWLPSLLRDIGDQTFSNHEVIVADAHSTDATRKIAESRGCTVVDGGLPGVGRNAGARVARGDYLVFLDADVRIGKDFIEKAFAEFRARRLGLAICTFLPDSRESVAVFLYRTYNVVVRSGEHLWPNVAGGAFLITTRRLFERLGGYDETMMVTEDNDLISRARKISRVGVLHSVQCTASIRRIVKEGPVRYLSMVLFTKAYQLFCGKVRSCKLLWFEYGWGDGSGHPADQAAERSDTLGDHGRSARWKTPVR